MTPVVWSRVLIFLEFCCSIVDYEEQNHMTPDNLATVICPNLLRAPNNNFGLIMKNMGPITVLFKAFLAHVRILLARAPFQVRIY